MAIKKWHDISGCIIFMSLSVILIIVILIPEVYPSIQYYNLDDNTKQGFAILATISFFIFLIFCYLFTNGHKTLEEDLPENPTISTSSGSRPRLGPIPYLRTLSLPTYEMAMNKLNRKKEEETPPPKFDELQFQNVHC